MKLTQFLRITRFRGRPPAAAGAQRAEETLARPPHGGRGQWLTALALGLAAFLVYNSHLRLINSGDHYPARYLPFAIWRDGTLYLDSIAALAWHLGERVHRRAANVESRTLATHPSNASRPGAVAPIRKFAGPFPGAGIRPRTRRTAAEQQNDREHHGVPYRQPARERDVGLQDVREVRLGDQAVMRTVGQRSPRFGSEELTVVLKSLA